MNNINHHSTTIPETSNHEPQTSLNDINDLASDPDGVYTTDHSDYSGSDDEHFSSPGDTDSEYSEVENTILDLSPRDQRIKNLVEPLFRKGHKGPEIIRILSQDHGIKISPRTLSRKRNECSLRRCDLSRAPIPAPLSPEVRGSILSSQSKGMNLKEMQVRLYKETGVEVSVRTVQRYMKKLGVKLLQNDLLDGKVTIDRVLEAITDARENLLQNNAGYRRMRMILMRHYNIRVPRQIVYYALKQIDPDGMALRLRQACKRRIYWTLGPNHIWACDGHDKLKPFGITIYGFIDAWSRKILGMFVHVTNNNPRHIACYFLHLASKAGGLPLKLTSDYGTKTIDMAKLQMRLSHAYAGITTKQAVDRMHFTKSTHNQKIKSLWSQMMKQHNRSIKDDIMNEIDSGRYDQEDGVQNVPKECRYLGGLIQSLPKTIR
ncbi:hypothetical protein PGT21_034700 [Puccinia graminis f. sp. tritici]|uniref:Integrase core domain-containing protein n=1 Tax=Puccinia graminis f. sp. tritici TaxID=56615 RepID=A0A5B0PC90_PUCGR|nr:hypothetical protein PGT21_034700 [Puccinia graminis f. sp. tritici]KAA1125675.1 hypothetical protein PGTUg99_019969 [Puccinia graminis f. sp. tritici]